MFGGTYSLPFSYLRLGAIDDKAVFRLVLSGWPRHLWVVNLADMSGGVWFVRITGRPFKRKNRRGPAT